MENIIYYTFSTIPQVLGTAIALLGVFCLYKIQDFNNQLKGWAGAYLLEFERSADNKEKVEEQDKFVISQLSKSIEKTHIPDIHEALEKIVEFLPTNSFKFHLRIFDQKLEARRKLVRSTLRCIIFTIFVIVISFVPIVYSLEFSICGAQTVAVFGILLLVINLIWVGKVIYDSLKLDEQRTSEQEKK